MKTYRLLVGVFLLALLGGWAQYSCPYPALAEILANPEKYAGTRVAVFIEARVTALTADGFILAQRGQLLRVHTAIKNAPLNEFVAVAGNFQPPNHLHADTVHLASGRRAKMAVSVIPVLLLVVLVPMALRFDRQTRTFTLHQGKSFFLFCLLSFFNPR